MREINLTKSYIEAVSPNAKTLKNARRLINSFYDMRIDPELMRLYAGCRGSAESPYNVYVSLDGSLDCGCSCPSRQSPCKHVLGLLILYESGPGAFSICSGTPEPIPRLHQAKAPEGVPARLSSAARKKNLLRLHGLQAAFSMCEELIEYGLGRTSALHGLLEKSQALIAYKLPEVCYRWRGVLYTLLGDGPDKSQRAFDMLSKYHYALKDALEYCTSRANDGTFPVDYKIESWIGAAWTLEQLENMENFTDNARLMQLSFSVKDNGPAKRLEEVGIWMELESGKLVRTVNPRPYGALSRTKESDSFSDVLIAPRLYLYPLGDRVRWKKFSCAEPVDADFRALVDHAVPGGDGLRNFVIKRILDAWEDALPNALVGFDRILSGERGLVLIDKTGGRIELSGEWARDIVSSLPLERFSAALLEFSIEGSLIVASPLSLVGKSELFRLDS